MTTTLVIPFSQACPTTSQLLAQGKRCVGYAMDVAKGQYVLTVADIRPAPQRQGELLGRAGEDMGGFSGNVKESFPEGTF